MIIDAKTILVVDDELDILSQMNMALSQEGFQVKSAADGLLGLEEFQKHKPDICILDYKMPGMNGLELLKKIKEIDPKCEVIFISGNADMKVAVKAIKEHAFDFLQKPVDLNDLIKKINEVIKGMTVKNKYEGSFGGGILNHKIGEYYNSISEISINMDLDEYVSPKIKNELEKLSSNRMLQTHVVLLLGRVNRINNVGLNTLIDIYESFNKNGYKIAITNLSSPVSDYLTILGYDKYFQILKSGPNSISDFSMT